MKRGLLILGAVCMLVGFGALSVSAQSQLDKKIMALNLEKQRYHDSRLKVFMRLVLKGTKYEISAFLHRETHINVNDVITDGEYKGMFALEQAVLRGDKNIVKALLASGYNYTNLEYAIRKQCSPKPVWIWRVDVNAVITDGEYKGMSVLALAVWRENEDIVEEFLKRKDLDVNAVITDGEYKGMSAFTLAVWRGNENIVKELLKREDLDVNAVITDGCFKGMTALDLAANVEIKTELENFLQAKQMREAVSNELNKALQK